MWTYADCHKLEEFIGNKSLFIRIKTEKFIKKREKASTTYPQQCADVFWLHMQRKRGGREGERERFFFFLSFFFYPVVDLSKGLVRLSFLFFLLLLSFLFVRARHISNDGSYRRRTYTNDNLRHRAFVCWGMPDLQEIASWLDERNDVGREEKK